MSGLSVRAKASPLLDVPAPLPRLYVQRPQPAYVHPAGLPEVARVLRCFGAQCTYGLRSVELVQGRPHHGSLQFGRLLVPGRILLYAQPRPPWRVRGHLDLSMRNRFEQAGAEFELTDMHTLIRWPGQSLRDFMLLDVLLHEIGHHHIQQYKGKRQVRVVRTCDHEAFAEHFAARARRECEEAGVL